MTFIPQEYNVEMYEILHSIMNKLNRRGYVPLEPGQYQKAVAAGYVKNVEHRAKFTQAGYDAYADLSRSHRQWQLAEGSAADAAADAEADAAGENPMTTYENPGAAIPQAFTFDDAELMYGMAANATRRRVRPGEEVQLAPNTTIRREDGDIVVRLYATDIVRYRPDDTITLNTGGHRTALTRNRINGLLSPKAEILSRHGKWMLKSASGIFPFENGVTLTSARGGVRENPPRIVHRTAHYKVYWNSEYREYEVRGEHDKAGDGYFTSDKQDAIDSANSMEESYGRGRRNPPMEFSDDDFGVFLWREDGVYDAADSVGNYKRELAAQKFADKLNETHRGDGGYVVRTLKYCRSRPTRKYAMCPHCEASFEVSRTGGVFPEHSFNRQRCPMSGEKA